MPETRIVTDAMLDALFAEGGNGGECPPDIIATEEFDRTMVDLNRERGADYGHPYVNFGRIAHFDAVIDDCPDPRLRHVLRQIGVKMARLVENPQHLDSWYDIAGYARTACMVLDAYDKRKEATDGEEEGD